MADSDDEFDRRRRDKFTRERNDYRDRRDYERDNYGRGGRDHGRDYERRRAYSPLRGGRDVSPPMKRSRYDSDQGLSQPAMMTFKQFLSSQDDCIDDQDAVKKYADYKTDFKRQQLEEFFKNHKDEEWFRVKYHPDECHKRKEDAQANIQRRLQVYEKIKNMGLLDNVSLDVDSNNDVIIRLMDTVAIFLEGGDEEDLKALDEPEQEIAPLVLEVSRPETKKLDLKESPGARKGDTPDGAEKAKASEGSEDSRNGDENQEPKETENEKKSPKEKDSWSSDDGDKAADADGREKSEKNDDEPEKGGDENTSDSHKSEPIKRPRHLHRTSSIFLRTLSPAITKQEVEAMCKNYNGFLRVALADPQLEKKFARRGWVTFQRNVNTKEICWKLNNIRLRDTELGAILNRDLTRRVRSVNGITAAKQVMKSDIKLAAKIIQNLDTQRELHMKGDESKNPLLINITDYLIEEASAEEEELLGGKEIEETKAENGNSLEKDEELTKVLDRLLLYLRIVHSMDYYAHSEYQNEDEMPNRCGIIHARGSMPTSSVSSQEIEDYVANFEQKCAVFVEPARSVALDEAKKLGLKNEAEEVEKFMTANCEQLDKDKFLCPLSGKKFKAPEFVHKHIQSRHGEKIDEVRKNTIYFNNYIMDPKRPALPEHPSNRPRATANASAASHGPDSMTLGPYGHYNGPGPFGYQPRPGYGHPSYPVRGYPPPDPYRYGGNKRGGYGGGGGPRGIRDPRPVVAYHDLDVPPEFDLF